MIVRVVLTPSERRELLRAVSVLGGDRYTNHIGHFQSIVRASIEPASSSVRPPSSRAFAIRVVSAESNDLNSTRVDRILLLGRPRTHSRRREFFKKPPFKPT